MPQARHALRHTRYALRLLLCVLVLTATLLHTSYGAAAGSSSANAEDEDDGVSMSPAVFAAFTAERTRPSSLSSSSSLQRAESDTTQPHPPVPRPTQQQQHTTTSDSESDRDKPNRRTHPLSSLPMAEAATLYERAMEAIYTQTNLTLFVERVRAGAGAGHGRLHWLLGILHAYGLGVAQDDRRAHFHYVQAARRGVAEAHVALSFRLRHAALYEGWRRGLKVQDLPPPQPHSSSSQKRPSRNEHAHHHGSYKDQIIFSSFTEREEEEEQEEREEEKRLSTEGMCGPAWLHHRAAARAVAKSYAGSLNTPWPQPAKDFFANHQAPLGSAGGLSAQRRRRAAQRRRDEAARQIQIRFYRADNDDREALRELCFLYLMGYAGLHRDWHESVRYAERLRATGDKRAYGMLGHLYLRGEAAMWPPVGRDVATAAAYYWRGAALGDAVSMHGLGYLHVHGYMKNNTLLPGLKRQYAPLLARELRRLAEDDTYSGRALMNENNNSSSSRSLHTSDHTSETSDERGRGVPQRYAVPDLNGAIAWYRHAAPMGEMESLEHLAELLSARNDPWSRSTVFSLLNLSSQHGQAFSALRLMELFHDDATKLSCAATLRVFDRVIASARWFDAESPSSDLLTADWYDYEEEAASEEDAIEEGLMAAQQAAQERQSAPPLPRYAENDGNNKGEEGKSGNNKQQQQKSQEDRYAADEVTAAMREPVALDRERLHELRRLGLLVRRRTRIIGDTVPAPFLSFAAASPLAAPPPPPPTAAQASIHTPQPPPSSSSSSSSSPSAPITLLQEPPAFVPDMPQASPYKGTWRTIGNGLYTFVRSLLPSDHAARQARFDSPPVVWLLENLALAEMGHRAAVWNCIDALDELIRVPGEGRSVQELVQEGLADAHHVAFAVDDDEEEGVVPEWVRAASDEETVYLQWYHTAPPPPSHTSGSNNENEHDALHEQQQQQQQQYDDTTSPSGASAVRLLSQTEAKQMLLLRLLQHPQVQASAEAALRLGDVYYYGTSALLGTNMSAAVSAYARAAAQNSSQALFNLGVLHQLGLAPLEGGNGATHDASARAAVLQAAAALPSHARLWRRVQQIIHYPALSTDAHWITQEDLARAYDYYMRAKAADPDAHAAVHAALWTLNLQWWWMYFRGGQQKEVGSAVPLSPTTTTTTTVTTTATAVVGSDAQVQNETMLAGHEAWQDVKSAAGMQGSEAVWSRAVRATSVWLSSTLKQAGTSVVRFVHMLQYDTIEKMVLGACMVVLFATLAVRQHIM